MIHLNNPLMSYQKALFVTQLLSCATDLECLVAECETFANQGNPQLCDQLSAALDRTLNEMRVILQGMKVTE